MIAREIERPGVVRVLLKEPDLRWDIAFIWRRGGYLSRAAQAWLECCASSRWRKARRRTNNRQLGRGYGG